MPRSDRFVATVLFTEIVGSTELASRLGDDAWRRVIRAYYRLIRQELKRVGGREVDTAGDGFFASFAVPADAARCGLAIIDRMWAQGIAIRAGLHTGEVHIVDGKVSGIAAHIGSRVANAAGDGEILATATVRDLATGSRLGFHDRGAHVLKGVPGEWALYGVDGGAAADRGPLPDLDRSLVPPEDEAPRRGRSRFLVVGIVALVVAVAGTVLVFALLPSKKPSAPAASPPAHGVTTGLARIDPATGKVVARVEFPLGNPGNHATVAVDADGYLETVDWVSGVIFRINPRSNTVVRIENLVLVDTERSTLRERVQNQVVSGAGRVWFAIGPSFVASNVETVVTEIDPHRLTARVIAHLPGEQMIGLAFGEGALWVLTDDAVVRVDPKNGETTKIGLGGADPAGVAAGEGSVWVIDGLAGTLLRIDPAKRTVADRIPLQSQPFFVSIGDHAVWVSERGRSETGLVERFPSDLASNSRAFDVGREPGEVEVGDGAAWVSNRRDGTLFRIDLGSGAITTIETGGFPDGLAVTDEAIWVTLTRERPGS